MENIKGMLTLYKSYTKEVQLVKIMVLVIINVWLLFIFWKIIALEGINITNNNVVLTKMETMLEPLLQILGIDVDKLNPNIVKMIIISMIIVISNLAVLYFSQMMAFIILGITARYSYKAYNNYINKETLNYYGFEKVAENLTDQEKVAILNEFIKENGIKDSHAIGYLQECVNKISNININKNELTLNIKNNWLDYKQQILSKIILHQKEQMDTIEKKTTWTWESIDYWTLMKIGGGVILLTVIIIGGYYYFSNSNNNEINAAERIKAENTLLITKEMQELKNIQQVQQQDFIEYQKCQEVILEKKNQQMEELMGLIMQHMEAQNATINITHETLKALLVVLNIKNIDEVMHPKDQNSNNRLLEIIREFSK